MSALGLAAVHFALPESRKPDLTISLMPGPITKSFLTIIKEPQFYTYAFTGSIAAAGLYAYIAGSPHVFMELFKVSERQYGWIFAAIALGLIISSQLNTVLLKKFKSEQIIPFALFCQSLTGVSLFMGTFFNLLGLSSTIFLILIFLGCQGFIFPNASALTMAPFSRNAGTASALMGAIQLGIGALASAIVSMLTNNTPLPMAGIMALCAITSFCVLMLGRRVIKYKASLNEAQQEIVEMISTS
jgi:DHA1 family bicyclomycin/chloramphenicol resistance-like MFS transporter